MNHHNRLSGLLLPTLFLAALLGACDNRQEDAQQAYAQYQAALAAGDLRQARIALGSLVTADDSNADYWMELGKVQMQLSDYGAAYDAFQRAHELNRANVEVLAVMTQLALRSGSLDIARENARQLELVAPNNPAVPLTKGYVALRRADLDEADRQAAAFSALSPYDSSGKILQARILLARGQPDRAVALLKEQVKLQPSDSASLQMLASIFELREEWGKATDALRAYLAYQPADKQARIRFIEDALWAGQNEEAAEVTLKAVENEDIDMLLAPWVSRGRQDIIADRLFAWAQTADTGRRIAVARFLATTGRPDRVIALAERDASLPVEPSNIIPNALYGGALVEAGRTQQGLTRLDAVIELDGRNQEALRARALARSRAGQHRLAIEDGQKLVAADRNLPSSRLLLARIYGASGDTDAARRTLWDAFHDIGGDRTIYDALRPLVLKSEGPDAAKRLSQEYYDSRNERLTRSFA